MSFAVLMATGELDFLSSWWGKPGSMAGPVLIMIGAMLVVGFVIFAWAAFFRKPRHGTHSHHHGADSDGGGLPARHKRRSKLARMLGKKRKKRRRSRERPLNPTLAQAGGLPPHRDEHPPS
jgi:hypothetical protein